MPGRSSPEGGIAAFNVDSGDAAWRYLSCSAILFGFSTRVCVIDVWWRKNHDVWRGYSVWVEGRDGIVRREWPVTKVHCGVVRAVREALVEAA